MSDLNEAHFHMMTNSRHFPENVLSMFDIKRENSQF